MVFYFQRRVRLVHSTTNSACGGDHVPWFNSRRCSYAKLARWRRLGDDPLARMSNNFHRLKRYGELATSLRSLSKEESPPHTQTGSDQRRRYRLFRDSFNPRFDPKQLKPHMGGGCCEGKRGHGKDGEPGDSGDHAGNCPSAKPMMRYARAARTGRTTLLLAKILEVPKPMISLHTTGPGVCVTSESDSIILGTYDV